MVIKKKPVKKKVIKKPKKKVTSKKQNKNKEHYVITIQNGKERSKQTFITRKSPNRAQLMEDVILQLMTYNTLHKTNWQYVECTCYNHEELKIVWPFKEDRYTDHITTEIELYGNYENRFKSEIINKLNPNSNKDV